MRRILFLSILLLLITTTFAQPASLPNVVKYTGDTIIITGRIYAGNYLKNVITKPTFLNVYDSSPLHMLMVRIDSGDRKNFPEAPEKLYLNKKVSIRGVLGDYKGVSLIKIVNSSLVEIDQNDPGPVPVTSTGSYMSGENFGFGKSDSLFRVRQDSIKLIIAADTSRPKKVQAASAQLKETLKQNQSNSPAQISAEPQKQPIIQDEIKTLPEPGKAIKPAPAKPEEASMADTTIAITPADILIVPENPKPADPKVEVPKQESKPDNIPINLPLTTPTIKTSNNIPDTASKSKYLKSISTQEFEPINEVWTVRDGEIEMRTSPNMDAPVLAYLMKKMTVRITNKSKKWSYVVVENPDGTIGLSGFIKNNVYKVLDKKE